MGDRLKILFISAEVSPYAKTGGLADVSGALPRELALEGADIRVVMPLYKSITAQMQAGPIIEIDLGIRKDTCKINTANIPYPIYFLENERLFGREGMYGHADDGERFAFFCLAALEMLPVIGFCPDVIHCNDWHTGPISMLLDERYRHDSFYKDIATVFTIHNLEYQGNFNSDVHKLFSVGSQVMIPDKAEFYGMFGFMKCGLAYSDVLSTVSKTYAAEIKTPQFGERMEGLLLKRSEDLFGIVNGISYSDYNPAEDVSLPFNYDSSNWQQKKLNKPFLQEQSGLPQVDVPVIGLVSRLSGQKGLNLILEKADELFSKDIQMIVLGTGEEYYEVEFQKLEHIYPQKISVNLDFNTSLARLIYAGADMFLMPSRFEPCGLGQLISLRYGAIPIVRATGGLAETIIDFDYNNKEGNGFSFYNFSSEALMNAIDRALYVYKEKPESWNEIVIRALSENNSWSRPARDYIKLYNLAVSRRKVK